MLVGIELLVGLAFVSSSLMQLDLLNQVKNGIFVTDAAVLENDARQSAIGLFSSLAYAIAGIAILCWVHRATKNLPSMGVTDPDFTPAWAVGWWFIPFANLWMPYPVMRAIWRGSRIGNQSGTVSPILLIWWIGFVLASIAYSLINIGSSNAKTIDSLMFITQLTIIVEAVYFAIGLLLLLVIWRVTMSQIRWYQSHRNA